MCFLNNNSVSCIFLLHLSHIAKGDRALVSTLRFTCVLECEILMKLAASQWWIYKMNLSYRQGAAMSTVFTVRTTAHSPQVRRECKFYSLSLKKYLFDLST